MRKLARNQPKFSSPNSFEVMGVIAAVNGNVDNGYGPASQIDYDVFVNFPDGVRRVNGVKPSHLRPPDVVDTQAARVDDVCHVLVVGEKLYFSIRELPRMDQECPP